MPRCIYCLKTSPEVTFDTTEHVIPQSFGTYEPLTPTLEELVCDSCNSLFSKLETKLREDTFEGVFGQRLNFQNKNSITIRNKNFKITSLSEFKDPMFTRTFFLFKIEDEKIVPDIKPHITIKMKNGGYRVFLIEALKRIEKDTSRFNKLKKDISKLSKEDIWIFVPRDDASLKEAESILKDYGIEYTEKSRGIAGEETPEAVEVIEDYQGVVDKEICRVLAKIVFNYFTYCAKEQGMADLVFSPNFDPIRNFILNGAGYSDTFVHMPERRILGQEVGTNRYVFGHTVCFGEDEAGKVYCHLVLFSFRPYTISLGILPQEIKNQLFGCGHVFDPVTKRIENIAQNTQPRMPDALDLSFGLYKRFR